jgi:hypothetical protein
MAKIFLNAGETFNVGANSVANVVGNSGAERVSIVSGEIIADQNVERIDLPNASSTYKFAVSGNQVKIYTGTTLVATYDAGGTNQVVAFSNGSAPLVYNGQNAVTLGGAAIPAVAATITPTVNPSDTSSSATGGSTATGVAGSTFTLTQNGDTFDPTNATAAYKTTTGDDTFRAPSTGNLDSADFIDGGAGTDVLTAAITAGSQTIAPMIKNVESITLTIAAASSATTAFDATDVIGTNTLTIKNASVNFNAANEVTTINNLAKTTTLGILGGTGLPRITANFASVAAADTQNVAISTLGTVGTLTLSTAETVNIAATGTGATGANTIGSLAATAVKTLNITGSGDLTIAASTLSATPTVNATTATGVINFTGATAATTTIFNGGTGATTVTTASTGIVKVTTGAGADTVDISGGNSTATIITGAGNDVVKVGAASNITALDSIAGGDGTDTIVITDATINATTKTTLALGVSGFEIVKTTATNTLPVSIDFNALSTYNTVEVSARTAAAAAATTGATANAGDDAITATIENTDTLVISGTIIGAAGNSSAINGGKGGDAITLTPRLDNGSNVANLTILGDVDVTGGKGGSATGASSVSGSGDSAVDAISIETLNIHLQGTSSSSSASVDFTAGAAGDTASSATPGSAGDTIEVNSNATINVTDELIGSATKYNNLDLGTVVGSNVTINASTFHGTLKVAVKSSGAGNVAITGGSAADTLTGGTGQDQISGGAGADSITGGTGADVLTGGADADTFAFGSTGSVSGTAQDEITDFTKASDILSFPTVTVLAAETNGTTATSDVDTTTGGKISFAPADDTFAEMVTAILADSELEATGSTAFFEFGGDTYVYNAGASGSATDDQIIKLTGVTGLVTITDLGTTLTIA